MGSFDCYCALCCGPLGIHNIKFGSKKAKALAKRRKRVNQKKRRLAGEDVMHEDSREWQVMEEEEYPKKKKPEEGADIRALPNEHGDQAADVDLADVDEDVDEEIAEDDDNNDTEDNDGPWDSNESSISTIDEELASGEDFSDNEVDELAAEEQEWEDNPNPYSSSHSDHGSNNDRDDDEHNSDWSNDSELSIEGYDFHRDSRDETASLYDYYEKHSYDPDSLGREDVQWIDRCRVLGINPTLEDDKVAFISGRGRYSDLFDFNVKSHGSDPRDPLIGSHPVYHCYEPEETTATFPFHEECFKLLVRCLGYEHRKEVDKDVLYKVMTQSVQELDRHLRFDYGDVEGAEQFWECFAGTEWSVTAPGTKEGIEEVVKSMLPAQLFHRPETQDLDLSHKVKHDPLAVLPYDVLHGIFANLSIKDTKSLINASLHVFNCTRDPAFWRQMIRSHITPFFWEVDGLFRATSLPGTFNWKGAFQWLNKVTKPMFAMEGPLMAIANRRRIWDVCQQLAPLYYEKLNTDAYTEPDATEAATIMETAKAYDIRVTMFPSPTPSETRTINAQFIRSWSEIGYRACDLDTYWTEQDGGLIGVSINFGSTLRVFGSTQGVKGQSLHIKAGEWIKEFGLSFWNIALYPKNDYKDVIQGKDDPRAIQPSHIDGMMIRLTSGKKKQVKLINHSRSLRFLTTLPGMHIVGMTGEITSTGMISKLSLLQVPDPSTRPLFPNPTYTRPETCLWNPSHHHHYSRAQKRNFPIWSHPDLALITLASPHQPPSPSFLCPDMLPFSVMLWAGYHQSHNILSRISTFEIADEHGPSSILGMWHKTTHKHGIANHIGTGGPVCAQMGEMWEKGEEFELYSKLKSWEDKWMNNFEIDGPGGEVVLEVHVTENRRGFRLVTSKGRVGSFGECDGIGKWDVVKAAEGQAVLGLSACFGNIGGWSEAKKRWSHCGLWDLGVVVSKVEGRKKVC